MMTFFMDVTLSFVRAQDLCSAREWIQKESAGVRDGLPNFNPLCSAHAELRLDSAHNCE